MNKNQGVDIKKEEVSELKFYIPEDLSASIETEGIIKLLLTQFKEIGLLDAIDGIQRYRNVIEVTVFADYKQKFLMTPITWSRCSSYLVTENEPIIIINIYAARLTSRWSDLVNKFNEFGKVVIYYDLKENYDGHEIKTGGRSIWLKDVAKRPKELTQGNRKLRVVYDKDIMNKLLSMNETDSDKSKEFDDNIQDDIDEKSSELYKETKDFQINKDYELPEILKTDNNSACTKGVIEELKDQLQTITDHDDEPIETVSKVGLGINRGALKTYYTGEIETSLDLQTKQDKNAFLQASSQQQRPLQVLPHKLQQEILSKTVGRWGDKTSM